MASVHRGGWVVSVNVGVARSLRWGGRTVTTGIVKEPVEGTVAIGQESLGGDEQADLRVHGGPDKAVYAYAAEDYRWWSDQLRTPLEPGRFGENLTTEGIDLAGAVVGEQWRVGSAVLAVSEPRLPCFKLGMRMGDAGFVARFADARRPGAYLRVVETGSVRAGDTISVVSRPDHGLRVVDIVDAHAGDHDLTERIAGNADVASGWTAWARRELARKPRSR
jgi:MOSC domain-containing protein YiiM